MAHLQSIRSRSRSRESLFVLEASDLPCEFGVQGHAIRRHKLGIRHKRLFTSDNDLRQAGANQSSQLTTSTGKKDSNSTAEYSRLKGKCHETLSRTGSSRTHQSKDTLEVPNHRTGSSINDNLRKVRSLHDISDNTSKSGRYRELGTQTSARKRNLGDGGQAAKTGVPGNTSCRICYTYHATSGVESSNIPGPVRNAEASDLVPILNCHGSSQFNSKPLSNLHRLSVLQNLKLRSDPSHPGILQAISSSASGHQHLLQYPFKIITPTLNLQDNLRNSVPSQAKDKIQHYHRGPAHFSGNILPTLPKISHLDEKQYPAPEMQGTADRHGRDTIPKGSSDAQRHQDFHHTPHLLKENVQKRQMNSTGGHHLSRYSVKHSENGSSATSAAGDTSRAGETSYRRQSEFERSNPSHPCDVIIEKMLQRSQMDPGQILMEHLADSEMIKEVFMEETKTTTDTVRQEYLFQKHEDNSNNSNPHLELHLSSESVHQEIDSKSQNIEKADFSQSQVAQKALETTFSPDNLSKTSPEPVHTEPTFLTETRGDIATEQADGNAGAIHQSHDETSSSMEHAVPSQSVGESDIRNANDNTNDSPGAGKHGHTNELFEGVDMADSIQFPEMVSGLEHKAKPIVRQTDICNAENVSDVVWNETILSNSSIDDSVKSKENLGTITGNVAKTPNSSQQTTGRCHIDTIAHSIKQCPGTNQLVTGDDIMNHCQTDTEDNRSFTRESGSSHSKDRDIRNTREGSASFCYREKQKQDSLHTTLNSLPVHPKAPHLPDCAPPMKLESVYSHEQSSNVGSANNNRHPNHETISNLPQHAATSDNSAAGNRVEWIVCRDYRSATSNSTEYGGKNNVWTKDNVLKNDGTKVNKSGFDTLDDSVSRMTHGIPNETVKDSHITSECHPKYMKVVTHDRQTEGSYVPISAIGPSNSDEKIHLTPIDPQSIIAKNRHLNSGTRDVDDRHGPSTETHLSKFNNEGAKTNLCRRQSQSSESLLASKLSWKFSDLAKQRSKNFTDRSNHFLGNRLITREVHLNRPISRELMYRTRTPSREMKSRNRPLSKDSMRVRYSIPGYLSARPASVEDLTRLVRHFQSDEFPVYRPFSREKPLVPKQPAEKLRSGTKWNPQEKESFKQPISKQDAAQFIHTVNTLQSYQTGDTNSQPTANDTTQEMLDYFWSYQGMGRQILGVKSGDRSHHQGKESDNYLMLDKFERLPPIDHANRVDPGTEKEKGLQTSVENYKRDKELAEKRRVQLIVKLPQETQDEE